MGICCRWVAPTWAQHLGTFPPILSLTITIQTHLARSLRIPHLYRRARPHAPNEPLTMGAGGDSEGTRGDSYVHGGVHVKSTFFPQCVPLVPLALHFFTKSDDENKANKASSYDGILDSRVSA